MDTKDILSVNSIPVIYQQMGLYEGHIPICPMPFDTPIIHWRGVPIPADLWDQIVSFMRWTHRKFRSEAQLRLYYNELSNEWGVAVMPQEVETGLSSKEIEKHEGRALVFSKFPSEQGWREAGTVHHHCSCSAFQSGVDLDDEKEKNGLHITLGDMESNVLHSFHARVSFRGVMYPAFPAQWVETEFVARKFPFDDDLQVKDSRKHFPNSWKRFLIPKKKTVTKPWRAKQGRRTNVVEWNNKNTTPVSEVNQRVIDDRLDVEDIREAAELWRTVYELLPEALEFSTPEDVLGYAESLSLAADELMRVPQTVGVDTPPVFDIIQDLDNFVTQSFCLSTQNVRAMEDAIVELERMGFFEAEKQDEVLETLRTKARKVNATVSVPGQGVPPVGGGVVYL